MIFAEASSNLISAAGLYQAIIRQDPNSLFKVRQETRKDINKRLIKKLFDKENDDLQSGTLLSGQISA